MGNISKWVFSLLLVLTMIVYIVYSTDVIVFDTKKDVYVSAIRTASQVATTEILNTQDVNYTYDGNRREPEDIAINLDSLNEFKNTLIRILDSKKDGSLTGVTNISIPLSGAVTYDYIVGITYDNSYLLPVGYTYKMIDATVPTELRNKVWNFTLGNNVYIDGDEYRIDGTKLINKDNTLEFELSNFLDTYNFENLEEFSDYIVMDCINTYLVEYCGASFSEIANNTQTSLTFELEKSKYSSNRGEYNTDSGVIDGPGLFAIVDVYTGEGSNQHLYQRIASFGGSELIER